MINDFKTHDLEILESYFYNYRKNMDKLRRRKFELLENKLHLPEEEQNKILHDDPFHRNCQLISESVEEIYNAADEKMKQFIMVRYWDDKTNMFEWGEVAEILGVTRPRAYQYRRMLARKLADAIGYIF